MRSHAKASTAGSTQRQAKGLGGIFRGAFATRGALLPSKGSSASKNGLLALALCTGLIASLAFGASPAAASEVHNFKEFLGSAELAAISEGRNVAIDQSNGDVLVMDEAGPRILRFKPNGTPDNFSALGTNVIDGKEGADTTPQGKLSFSVSSESQIAVDNSGGATDGDIYVTHGFPNLIDIFSKTGAYLGQLAESSGGSFSEACGVAVDSTGAVYVGDYGGGIHKFVPSANPPVDADNTANFTTTTNPCNLAAGAGPTAGFLFAAEYNGAVSKIDSSTGELKYTVVSGEHTTVGVDPANGHVFAAAGSTLEEFDVSGAASAAELSSTKNTETIRGIGVRASSGEIYLTGQTNVKVYDDPIVTVPDTLTTAVTGNTGTHATLNGTVNPNGFELSECFFEWTKRDATPNSFEPYEHTAPCAESPATIGTGTSPVAVHVDLSNLQPNGTGYHFRLIAKNPQGPSQVPNDEGFTTADTVITTAATPVTDTGATLNGSVNPDGVAITACEFEWGVSTEYGNAAPCVPNAAGIGSGTSPVSVHADLSGLHTGTVYHYRLKAANANGPILGGDETLQSAGPLILDTWAENVLVTEAKLKAEIDPEGSATTYHFEYGPTAAYGSESEELNVASDSSVHEVFGSLDELQPGTTYHYHVVATSAAGTNEGPDRTIRTFAPFTAETDCANQANRYGGGAALPDCRAYEMVTPVDKDNANIVAFGDPNGDNLATLDQSSTSGDRLAYGTFRAFGDAESAPWTVEYVAARGEEGWSSHGISPPRTHLIGAAIGAFASEFDAFTPDLCQAWLHPYGDPPLSEDAIAGYQNLYRRQDEECGGRRYEALTTVQPPAIAAANFSTEPQGFSADASHSIFAANDALTADPQVGPGFGPAAARLYEHVGAQLRYVCILPNGAASTSPCTAGGGEALGTNGGNKNARLDNAISADGSRIFWTNGEIGGGVGPIYVRIGGTETIAVSKVAEEESGTSSSSYWTAAEDGSKAIFTTGGDLYEFDVDSETTHLIAGGVKGLMGASEDASHIYFVSEEVLDAGATVGGHNLYFYEAGEGGGEYRFIAQLADGEPDKADFDPLPANHISRVTPDGLRAAFVSFVPLTGYDNTDLNNGEPVGEVYRYDAMANGGAGKLICVSCNPSGQLPEGPTVSELSEKPYPTGGLPKPFTNLQKPHVLSDDGTRLFFESYDSLTPRDSNGRKDVYEWEAVGSGGCDEGDSSFAPSADGCVSLISTGQSAVNAEFVDATPGGSDVFISTVSSLVPQDYGLRDIYDARVGGGYPLPPEAPECVGDACQSIPAAPNDPTPASAGFRGAGSPQPRKAHKRHCRARASHAGKQAKRQAKRKAAKSCKRAKRRAGR